MKAGLSRLLQAFALFLGSGLLGCAAPGITALERVRRLIGVAGLGESR
jgi:hypothetical protein